MIDEGRARRAKPKVLYGTENNVMARDRLDLDHTAIEGDNGRRKHRRTGFERGPQASAKALCHDRAGAPRKHVSDGLAVGAQCVDGENPVLM